jgi:hypothetical protein
MISSHWKTFLPLTLLLAVLTALCQENPNARNSNYMISKMIHGSFITWLMIHVIPRK